jgi:hypothetical protein
VVAIRTLKAQTHGSTLSWEYPGFTCFAFVPIILRTTSNPQLQACYINDEPYWRWRCTACLHHVAATGVLTCVPHGQYSDPVDLSRYDAG